MIPEKPSIYLGQEFSIEVSITGSKQRIMWLGAQISGFAISKTDLSQSLFRKELPGSYLLSTNNTVFNFVMSGSRMIATDFQAPSTFLINLFIDNVLPSYSGKSIDIEYELCIFAQTSGKPVISKKVPITILSARDKTFNLIQTQTQSVFKLETIKKETKDNCYATISSFIQTNIKQNKAKTILEDENGLNIDIEVETVTKAGSELTGKIDMKNSKIKNLTASIKLISKEFIKCENELSDINVISSQEIPLNYFIMKRFKVFIPYNIGTSFETELFTISYEIQFSFHDNENQQNEKEMIWSATIVIDPPDVSISPSRILAD